MSLRLNSIIKLGDDYVFGVALQHLLCRLVTFTRRQLLAKK